MTEKQFKKVRNNYYENIQTIGNLKEVIKNLDDDLTIECLVHKLDNTYIIKEAYLCANMAEEPILELEIKTDWDLTERDELRQELNCEKPLFTKKRLHQENQELTDEIHKIKNTIQEAYKTERTDLGKSVLKQLMEQLQ